LLEIGDVRELLDRFDMLIVAGIPAFNEEKTIARVVLGAQKRAHIVVVCDDGSTDLTGEIAERLGAVVVRHERNKGYGAAVQSLFRQAQTFKADVFVTLDADGQHNPDEIPRLIKPIKDGVAEVVLGSRFLDKNGTSEMPTYRQLGVKVITKLSNGSDKNGISDSQSGFRAYSKRAIESLGSISEKGMGASIELLKAIKKNRLKVLEVPITCKYSNDDGIKTSTENGFTHGMGLLASLIKLVVEDRPLPFLGIPGILSLSAGIFFGVWMLSIYSARHVIETNIALAALAFVLIGFFLLLTAVILYSITFSISRLASKTK
jgi:glycosyltransferase involved in cell wall biosynthesis